MKVPGVMLWGGKLKKSERLERLSVIKKKKKLP